MIVVDKRRDHEVAYDAARRWLEEHGVHIETGVVFALARAMIDAVDEARARRQQEH